MTHLLPSNLLRLFAPRPAIPYIRPLGRDPDVPLRKVLGGVGALLEEEREQAALKEAEEEEKKSKLAGAGGSKAAKEEQGKGDSEDPSMLVHGEDGDKENKPSTDAIPAETGEIEEGEEGEAVEAAPDGEKKALRPRPAKTDADVEEPGFTHTEAEKYRLRVIERKRKREEGLKRGLETCEWDPFRFFPPHSMCSFALFPAVRQTHRRPRDGG